MTVHIEIDGKPLEAAAGSMIIQAADAVGIYIPRFCYHRKLSVAANCRMCLVEVEKSPRPLPACATPVTDGMKVFTQSVTAVRAQQGVMEFLLINHPLDCPICDQGGECDLQDLAVGFGGDSSRYLEDKRVVTNKNLGPLIATDMTRCIHCTRCVRFGREIGGVMELGMVGRGEHAEITAFVERTVDSELSGNMIDLCPVGALTSKPFRFAARTWELGRHPSISPHCGLGSNLEIQVKTDRVVRVLPRENESINECWLSDRERFSYEGLNTPDRLHKPMMRQDGHWRECEWAEALDFVAGELKRIATGSGPDALGALVSPHSTLEECYLMQKLVRALGCNNIDHRLRHSDFRLDRVITGAPWLGCDIASLNALQTVLLVGSTLRKDHPLLAHRLRQAAKCGMQLNVVNPMDDDLCMAVANKMIVSPDAMVEALQQILKALMENSNTAFANLAGDLLKDVSTTDKARSIATSLTAQVVQSEGRNCAIFLGNIAQHHPRYAEMYSLALALAQGLEASFGVLGEAASSVGACLAGVLPGYGAGMSPQAPGLNAQAMLEAPRKAYLLLGLEPELDSYNPQLTLTALRQAELVVAMTAYRNHALEYAHVLLPIVPFTETAGTFVNTEGRLQSFEAVTHPQGEARPAWKVIRVLGNLLGLQALDYSTSKEILHEWEGQLGAGAEAGRSYLNNHLKEYCFVRREHMRVEGLQRIGEVPIYQADPIVRRSYSLQNSRDGASPCAWMHPTLMEKLGIQEGDRVKLAQGAGKAVLPAHANPGLALDCVRVASAHPLTADLGGMFDAISVERAS